MVAIFQAMAGSMIYSTMSTLEKRYAFDSKVSSIIFIADNILWLFLSPIAGYYAPRFNRSRLLGLGQLLVSAMCFLSALPYFIYGPLLNNEFTFSNSTLHQSMTSSAIRDNFQLCNTNALVRVEKTCSAAQTSSNTIWPAVAILFVANFFRGTGSTIYMVIGLPYVDDNVSKKRSPLYMSLLHTILLIGPVLGFLLSGFCLTLYEDPFNDPGFGPNDPRFIGAWWLGYVIVGFFNLVSALPMFLYPAEFKNAPVKAEIIKKKLKESGGTVDAIMRLVRNPLVVLFTIGNALRYFGAMGFFMLLTKYIEAQYRQTSAQASVLSGTSGLTPAALGILAGGLLITWFRPKTRTLFILIFVAEFSTSFTCSSGLFLGCDSIKLAGKKLESRISLESNCNRDCHCSTQTYTPICGPDRITTYFSPCHAGCTSYNSSSLTFENCSCFSGTATKGYCPSDETCPYLPFYMYALALGSFVQSMARTGNSLITFRTVEPMDKTFANGLLGSLVSIASLIPSPLFYAYIADSSCLVWEEKCGKRGNCWFYNQDRFRHLFIGVSVAFMALGSLFDFIMIFYADRVKDFYSEDDENEET